MHFLPVHAFFIDMPKVCMPIVDMPLNHMPFFQNALQPHAFLPTCLFSNCPNTGEPYRISRSRTRTWIHGHSPPLHKQCVLAKATKYLNISDNWAFLTYDYETCSN